MADKPPIDIEEARRIANLAHLALAEEELAAITQDLQQILQYVEKLAELDTSDVVPTTHAIELLTHFRADEARPGLPIDRALQNAPERIGDGFGVPKVLP